MASGDRFQTGTATGTASTFTMPTSTRRVEVMNRSGAGEVFFSTDGATPTVGGNFRCVPAAVGAALVVEMEGGGTDVKVIASASTTVAVSVAG